MTADSRDAWDFEPDDRTPCELMQDAYESLERAAVPQPFGIIDPIHGLGWCEEGSAKWELWHRWTRLLSENMHDRHAWAPGGEGMP